jgi:hypothetical protein
MIKLEKNKLQKRIRSHLMSSYQIDLLRYQRAEISFQKLCSILSEGLSTELEKDSNKEEFINNCKDHKPKSSNS